MCFPNFSCDLWQLCATSLLSRRSQRSGIFTLINHSIGDIMKFGLRSSRLLGLVAAPVFAALALGSTAALASESPEQYPSRPIRLIVPFAPGGVTDTGARIVADRLGQQLGQPIIVDNKMGASSNIGTQMAAKATSDGYSMLVCFGCSLVIKWYVQKSLTFNTRRGLAPVSKIGDAALMIGSNTS